jgi:8-oxo-dGTP pyrophosphatase MutT (NUDIX family)
VTAKKAAFGAVVIDASGRVLLRSTSGGYGGYGWTFPKGRPDPGEAPEDTALRETREETGWTGEVVARIPGVFSGDVTDTTYFLMRPTEQVGNPDPDETLEVRWVRPDEARMLIEQTPNPNGRKRDLAVLEAALHTHAEQACP